MKVSLNWIKKYVDLPEDLSLAGLSHDLTMRTVEVEDAINPAENLQNILVGIITEIEPHPQADLLRVCQVDLGKEEPSTIVCGGSNIKVGMPVAVAIPGAYVRWHGEGEPVLIKPSKLRGVKSDGMICAAAEMQLESLFPATDDHEILDLSQFPAQAGTPLAQALGLDDIILEIDNKSLTNRPDLWCHYGLARELAAIYNRPLLPLPTFSKPTGLPEFPVKIEAPERCRRYAALQYEGMRNEPSPYALKLALWKVGIRPISSLVDITNFVMLDVGQPTHAFDKNLVQEEIVVRLARAGESLTLLDGKELQLNQDDLMICDHKHPIALAGVMGGAEDSILPGTNNMLLEIANFSPRGVRRSAMRYQVRTESANRNEKGLDTQRVDQAMAAADKLIKELYPDAHLTAFTDRAPGKTECPVVSVSLDWLSTRLGRPLNVMDARRSLEPLGFIVEENQGKLQVKVPSWRATGDVNEKDDVLEEIARMIGYENFEFIPPQVRLTKAINQTGVQLERNLREYLAREGAMQEVYTYPWVKDQYLRAAGLATEDCLQLSTPPAPDTACLRPTLVPSMLEACALNLRYLDAFRMFELAQVYSQGQTYPSDPHEALPLQWRSLAGVLVGKNPRELFRQAKGILEAIPRAVMAEDLRLVQIEQPLWADSKAWINIVSNDKTIGSLGLVSSQCLKDADIKHASLAMFELNVEGIQPLPSRTNHYKPLPLYPLVEQDFSVLLDEAISWADLEKSLEKTVRSLRFVEEYRGKQIPQGKKSLMFSVSFGSDEATMTSQQIAEKVETIKKKLVKLGGELRM